MTVSLRLSEQDSALFRSYAEMHGMTLSDLFRQTLLERIEDEYDLKAYEEALAAYKANPATMTLEEVERELGFR